MSSRTYYLLGGGNDRNYSSFGAHFERFVSAHTAGEIRFLSCFFGRDESKWAQSADDWHAWLDDLFTKPVLYDVASVGSFVEQVNRADVIFLHGGTTKMLKDMLDSFDNLQEMFKGKIVIGSSAGANVLASTYYSSKSDQSGKGRGLVDVTTVVHYGADDDGDVSLSPQQWQRVIDRVSEDAESHEDLLLLQEGTFSIFVK